MNYSVTYYQKSQIRSLEKEWKLLEKGGDMTLFQSYDWNYMYTEVLLPDNNSNYESVYVLICRDKLPVLIAPLWVVKKRFRVVNTKGISIIGNESWSDYLNLVYDEFDEMAFEFLLTQLENRYKIRKCYFHQLRESSRLYNYICAKKNVKKKSLTICVSLELPTCVDEYEKLLSKSTRQNIRTANNRLKKDGVSMQFVWDDVSIDKALCIRMKEERTRRIYAGNVSYLRRIKNRWEYRLRFHFHSFYPMNHFAQSKFMTAYDEQGHLCAWFNYIVDISRKTILVISAGTNDDFARYSPGILLMHEFIHHAIEEGLKVVDFTRGDERYKFVLGGKPHDNFDVEFMI